MNARFFAKLVITTSVLTIISTRAEARRDQRDGLNFGSSIRLFSDKGNIGPTSLSKNNSENTSSSYAVTPYIGYAFRGWNLHLGLSSLIEKTDAKLIETSIDGKTRTEREESTSIKNLNLQARFLFARIMFFEGGLGMYQQSTEISKLTATNYDAASFEGAKENYKVEGFGPGYHLGVGAEFPIKDGFNFTTAYLVRTYQIRAKNSGEDLGTRLGRQQKSELSFGLSYYND